MQTLIATLAIFTLVALAMGVGVIFGGRELRGSCGGSGEDCRCSRAEQRECALKKAALSDSG